MKSWSWFLVSLGSLFVCVANLMEKPIYLMITGIACMIIGGILVRRERRKS